MSDSIRKVLLEHIPIGCAFCQIESQDKEVSKKYKIMESNVLFRDFFGEQQYLPEAFLELEILEENRKLELVCSEVMEENQEKTVKACCSRNDSCLSIKLVPDGEHIIIYIMDVTKNNNVENFIKTLKEDLSKSKNRYSVIAEYMFDWETWEDEFGTPRFVSESCYRISGYQATEFIENPELFSQIILPEDRFLWEEHRLNISCNLNNHKEQFRISHKNGEIVWIEHNCSPVKDKEGNFLGYRGNNRDITEQKNLEGIIRDREEKYRVLFENAVEAILVVQDTKIMIANPMIETLTGYREVELLNTSFLNLVYKEDRDPVVEFHKKRVHGDKNNEKQIFRIVTKSQEIRWVESDGIQIQWNGSLATLNFVMDITKRKMAEEALIASEEKYRFLTEFASDVIWVLNIEQQKYTYISPSVYQLRGITQEEALREELEDSLSQGMFELVKKAGEERIQEFMENPGEPKVYIDEIKQPHKNGSDVWVEVSTKYRMNEKNEVEIVGVSRNIEERKRAEEQVLYLSYNDQLTGLYNRRFYEEELVRIEYKKLFPISLVMADVNGLKLTNDAFGHTAGDHLLKSVAEILKNASRKNDIVARIGGDEFVMLLPNTDGKAAGEIVQRMQKSMDAISHTDIILSVSFGWATKEKESQRMEDVFTEAEDFMYRRKLLESSSMKSETINIITSSLYKKDNYIKIHCDNVSNFCKKIGESIGLTPNEVNELGLLGLLHDIGKIGISESILNKKGLLNDAEKEEVRRHPEIGYQILRSANEFSHIAEFVLCHHERVDGKGYPRGLKDKEIPIQAKILSVAEAYDTMISEFEYGHLFTMDEAIQEIVKNAGTQFDEKIAKVFVETVLERDWKAL